MPHFTIEDYHALVKRYLEGKASREEMELLERYYAHFDNGEKEPGVIEGLSEAEQAELDYQLRQGIQKKIRQAERPVPAINRRTYIQVAALFLLIVGSGTFYWTRIRHKPENSGAIAARPKIVHDIGPGNNKAILTLANGSTLVLDQVKDGVMAHQSGAVVTKADSLLSYKSDGKAAELTYNIITVPKGGQYRLILADGTKVWLNSLSSMRFPTAFQGNERTVELTGEGYFEVVKDPSRPFHVKTAAQTIDVLGTSFNINAYSDEKNVKTTLLEGGVRIRSAGDRAVVLKPGQQSLLDKNGRLEVADDVDTEEVTAWKNELFQFNDRDIETIMRQIGRWYNVDVVFTGPVPGATYHGKISRRANVSEVLKILELGGVSFTIEGNVIRVK